MQNSLLLHTRNLHSTYFCTLIFHIKSDFFSELVDSGYINAVNGCCIEDKSYFFVFKHNNDPCSKLLYKNISFLRLTLLKYIHKTDLTKRPQEFSRFILRHSNEIILLIYNLIVYSLINTPNSQVIIIFAQF